LGKREREELRFSSPTLIRVWAIIGVLIVHAQSENVVNPMNQMGIYRWWTLNFYQAIGSLSVPLFVMLTGLLLLQPEKIDEPLKTFFKKRWNRIAIPVVFWGAICFVWDFTVKQQPATSNYIVQSILKGGPQYQFWYIYMLIGLYLVTPILRPLIPHITKTLLIYLSIIWFAGMTLINTLPLFGYYVSSDLFMITEWVGYFILGVFLVKAQIKRVYLLLFVALGIIVIMIGSYYMALVGNHQLYWFQQYYSPTVIFTSIMLFILLNKISMQRIEANSKINWLFNKISENTLPIFLSHVIVMDSLEAGYLGFRISGNVLNSIVEVPLLAAATLAICLALFIPLKRVPIVKRLIG
jgi:surface polysaccharide O-acyltransferase-like enzyme